MDVKNGKEDNPGGHGDGSRMVDVDETPLVKISGGSGAIGGDEAPVVKISVETIVDVGETNGAVEDGHSKISKGAGKDA
uniref:Uncharacterized protein n=1 Tax=Cannabis sativa TaxID=3483 RepID=A0A803NS65_CANSA